jgi:hypothetical protein
MATEPGDVQEGLVEAQTFHIWSEAAEYFEDSGRKLSITPMGWGHDDQIPAQTQGDRRRLGGSDPIGARLVGGTGYHPSVPGTADRDRFSDQ